MNICFINASAGTLTGGSESIVHELITGLSINNQVSLITGRNMFYESEPNPLKDLNIAIVRVPFLNRHTYLNKVIAYILNRSRICSLVNFGNPYGIESLTFYTGVMLSQRARRLIETADVISVHYEGDSFLFSRYCEKLKKPVVFHLPGISMSNFFEGDKSSLYVANSKTTAEEVNFKYGHHIDSVVTPGIPDSVLDCGKIESSDNNLLYVGRVEKPKGLLKALEIFHVLLKSKPYLKFTILGKGDMLPYLKEYIDKNQLQESIILPGQVSYKEVFTYMSRSKVLIHPSQHESFGMTVVEAMAIGLPVVASDIPALREATRGSSILISLEKDASDWAEAILKILTDEKYAETIRQNQKMVAKDLAWSKKCKEYEVLLKKEVEQ